jgi:ubiquitin-protein ligase
MPRTNFLKPPKEITMAASTEKKLLWDPQKVSPPQSKPPKECLRRIRKDIKMLFKDPLPGVCVCVDEADMTLIHAIITGPFETPYEGGFFYFIARCPHDYPMSPPRVKLMTTGGGRVRFNPNLYANGKVCLSILGYVFFHPQTVFICICIGLGLDLDGAQLNVSNVTFAHPAVDVFQCSISWSFLVNSDLNELGLSN